MGETVERLACRIDDLRPGRGRAVEIDGVRLALYRTAGDDRVYALSARCPHAGGAMGFGWVEDEEAVCPLHRWRFHLRDGRCTTVRGESLRTYPCEVREGEVYVILSAGRSG